MSFDTVIFSMCEVYSKRFEYMKSNFHGDNLWRKLLTAWETAGVPAVLESKADL